MVELSVIIVSYNCPEQIRNCIDSLFKYNDIGNRLEVIVVDNSDDLETFTLIKEKYSNVKLIKNENNGFGQANNIGAKAASGEFLLFLNPDTLFISRIFSTALKRFNDGNDCFGVQLLDANNRRNSSFGLLNPMGLCRVFFGKVFHFFNVFIQPIMFISGADIFIKKEVFFDIGLFDDNIFMYFEETDLFSRMKMRNYKWRFYKDLKLVHLEGRATSHNFVKKYEMQIDSYKYVCMKLGLNYERDLRKEFHYCNLKHSLFSFAGNKQKADDYSKICSFLETQLRGANDA